MRLPSSGAGPSRLGSKVIFRDSPDYNWSACSAIRIRIRSLTVTHADFPSLSCQGEDGCGGGAVLLPALNPTKTPTRTPTPAMSTAEARYTHFFHFFHHFFQCFDRCLSLQLVRDPSHVLEGADEGFVRGNRAVELEAVTRGSSVEVNGDLPVSGEVPGMTSEGRVT